jgi:hypothetical protein
MVNLIPIPTPPFNLHPSLYQKTRSRSICIPFSHPPHPIHQHVNSAFLPTFHYHCWNHLIMRHNHLLPILWKSFCLSPCFYFSFQFSFFGSTVVWTEGLALRRQALYHLSHTLSPSLIVLSNIRICNQFFT